MGYLQSLVEVFFFQVVRSPDRKRVSERSCRAMWFRGENVILVAKAEQVARGWHVPNDEKGGHVLNDRFFSLQPSCGHCQYTCLSDAPMPSGPVVEHSDATASVDIFLVLRSGCSFCCILPNRLVGDISGSGHELAAASFENGKEVAGIPGSDLSILGSFGGDGASSTVQRRGRRIGPRSRGEGR